MTFNLGGAVPAAAFDAARETAAMASLQITRCLPAAAVALATGTCLAAGSPPPAALFTARPPAAGACSHGNRTIRIALGAVYMWSAFKFSDRLAKSAAKAKEQPTTVRRPSPPRPLGWCAPVAGCPSDTCAGLAQGLWPTIRPVVSLAGCGALCFIGAIWLSSGYHGQ